MGDQNNSSCILGFVPGRRVVGVSVADETSLYYFKAQWLKRFKTDGEKILVINRLLCTLTSQYKPRAIITLKLTPFRDTSFNQELFSFLRGLATSHLCPLYFYSMTEVKAILGHKTIKNIRQLSFMLCEKYPELKMYLPEDNTTKAARDREKYYQPIFIATALVNAHNKLIESKNEQLNLPC